MLWFYLTEATKCSFPFSQHNRILRMLPLCMYLICTLSVSVYGKSFILCASFNLPIPLYTTHIHKYIMNMYLYTLFCFHILFIFARHSINMSTTSGPGTAVNTTFGRLKIGPSSTVHMSARLHNRRNIKFNLFGIGYV